jgi:hypothetical protein
MSTDRQKTVSLRSLRKHVQAHDLRLLHAEQWQEKAARAIGATQAQGEWDAIQREAGDAALDARLRVHRADLDKLSRDVFNNQMANYANTYGLDVRVRAFESLTFLGRLRWLFTGKV